MLEGFWIGVGATVAVFAAAAWVLQQRGPDPGTVDHVHHLYSRGDITLAELERRLDVIEDPAADRIRETVERVNGIGEQTSWDIAAESDSLNDLRAADRHRLNRSRTWGWSEHGRWTSTCGNNHWS